LLLGWSGGGGFYYAYGERDHGDQAAAGDDRDLSQ